tara:strand:- start:1098 stop:1634 length:537 start_codon:yes stop_codon:yes gene_type:complete
MKNGDIFQWSYNEEHIKNIGGYTSTTYWCCSRIGVFNDGYLRDTFWSSGSSDKSFSVESIKNKLEVKFLSNEDDLVKSDPSMRAYYLDEDCVDLNHSNSTRGNFYIRKGAVKNLEKMERILRREKADHQYSIKSTLRSIELLEKELKNVTEDTFVSPRKDSISLDDKTWEEIEVEDKS